MFKVSMKGVLAHKTRLLLTALAVIMATAFLSSTGERNPGFKALLRV